MKIPVVIQHRHVHLSLQDFETLFGQTEPEILEPLSHHGQQVYTQTVQIFGSHGFFDSVRVLGPAREKTQVEISPTDAIAIGLHAPVRLSGDTTRAGTCRLKGSCGEISTTTSVIIPARHLHLNVVEAQRSHLQHGQIISLRPSKSALPIEYVSVRVHPSFATEFHLSTDEAATFWLQTGDHVELCV